MEVPCLRPSYHFLPDLSIVSLKKALKKLEKTVYKRRAICYNGLRALMNRWLGLPLTPTAR